LWHPGRSQVCLPEPRSAFEGMTKSITSIIIGKFSAAIISSPKVKLIDSIKDYEILLTTTALQNFKEKQIDEYCIIIP
jgi:hypothetical protein